MASHLDSASLECLTVETATATSVSSAKSRVKRGRGGVVDTFFSCHIGGFCWYVWRDHMMGKENTAAERKPPSV